MPMKRDKAVRFRNTPTLEVYKAKDGYRWRLLARNSKIIAEGGEAFKRRLHADALIGKIASDLATADWVDLT